MSTFEAVKKFGISKTYMRYMVHNIFYIPDSHKDCLALYKAEAIATDEFLYNIVEGTYTHPNDPSVAYQVIYYGTDPIRLKRRAEHTYVILSFRIAQPELEIDPTVLVKEIRE